MRRISQSRRCARKSSSSRARPASPSSQVSIQTELSAKDHGDVGPTRAAARLRSNSRACRQSLVMRESADHRDVVRDPVRVGAPAGSPAFRGARPTSATAPLQKRVGAAGGGGVDGVVEGVDGDLFLRPENRRRRDLERRQRDLGGAVDGGAVGDGRRPRRQPERSEEAADDAPAGAVAPVREVVEARAGEVAVEVGGPQRLGRRARRRAARRAGAPRRGRPRTS